jgi:hypothetical protein
VPFSSLPVCYDPFALGVSGTETKPFRITSISRSFDELFTLEAIEYDANVYAADSGTPIIPTITYSALKKIEPVTSLILSSYAYLDASGNVKCVIDGQFTKPAGNPAYAKARIFYRKYLDSSSLSYTYYGETLSNTFTMENVDLNTDYEVLIQSVGYEGLTTDMLVSPSETVTTASEAGNISVIDYKISGLQIFNQANDNAFIGKDCKFVWQPITSVVAYSGGAGEEAGGAGTNTPPVWFKDYEVKIYDTITGVLRRTEYLQNNEYTYTFEKNYEDTGVASRDFEIRVKARDRFFRTSSKQPYLLLQTMPLKQ